MYSYYNHTTTYFPYQTSQFVNVTLYVARQGQSVVDQTVLLNVYNSGSLSATILPGILVYYYSLQFRLTNEDTLVVAVRIEASVTAQKGGSYNGIPSGVISLTTPPSCNWKYCGSQAQCIGQPTLLTGAPLNTIDAACQRHDVCYDQGVLSHASCNALLVEEIRDAMSGCSMSLLIITHQC